MTKFFTVADILRVTKRYMKKIHSILIIISCVTSLMAQTTISGIVSDKNDAIIGANVFIEGKYDGTVTDTNGYFEFQSSEEGEITLSITYLGYESKTIISAISSLENIEIKLRASAMTLDAVEISASTFKAGDNSKLAVMTPMDVVTTAGSMGDVIAAMQTLPGTQSNADDGRLFIRGGEARETNIYIDGMKVFSPYSRTINGIPSRGRYSPFLFKGVSFSTGGYSTAFGQALSGILDMSTIDEPNDTETNINIMTVGFGIGHIQKGDRQSISISASFTDLSAYNMLVPSRADWTEPYLGFSGEAVYRYKTDKGLFKSYIAGDHGGFGLNTENIDSQADELVEIKNADIYSNNTYMHFLNEKTSMTAGFSIGYNDDQIVLRKSDQLDKGLMGMHGRLSFKTIFNDHFIANYGVDAVHQKDDISFSQESPIYEDQISRQIIGAHIETDYFFSQDLAIKTGLRTEYNTLLQQYSFLPRITIAQKIDQYSQVSAAAGLFSQEINTDLLYSNQSVGQEKAQHFLVNYNRKTENQILRIEGYYKNYQNLVRYDEVNNSFINVSNEGNGYAYGMDFFWRANQIIDNVDFWVSYSWLENKRTYKDYPTAATPRYSTDHNLSIVSKIWIPNLNSQLGVTYRMASGRPYDNPNTEGFMTERSGFYHDISLGWSYLISQQKILYISVANAPGFDNEYGFEYGNQKNEMGLYPGRQIRPFDNQFFFVGFFWTISKDKSKNQLNNL